MPIIKCKLRHCGLLNVTKSIKKLKCDNFFSILSSLVATKNENKNLGKILGYFPLKTPPGPLMYLCEHQKSGQETSDNLIAFKF